MFFYISLGIYILSVLIYFFVFMKVINFCKDKRYKNKIKDFINKNEEKIEKNEIFITERIILMGFMPLFNLVGVYSYIKILKEIKGDI